MRVAVLRQCSHIARGRTMLAFGGEAVKSGHDEVSLVGKAEHQVVRLTHPVG